MAKPTIRFRGFDDEWEQRKLGDIYGSIGNAFVGTATPYYAEQGHFYLESNNVKDGQINHNSEVFINDEFYEKQKDKWLHTGDMVMVQSGHVGHAAVIPEELDNTAAHALIMFRNPKEEIEPYFLNYEYQTDKSKKKIENITTGNTIKHILASDMQEFIVDVPKYEEQKVIAGYFRNIDYLITLHQRKCDETKKLKKYMLQKMFPQNGSKVPEIRFKGFTDEWEQRKLGEVFEQTSNLVNPKEDEIELWSLTVEDGLTKKSDRYNREFLVKKDDNFKEVRPGDIVYNPMNMTLGAVGYNGMAKSVAVSGYYTTMVTKENYDTYYINTWLKSPQAIQLYRTYATGSLIEKQRVQFPTLSIIPVAFPKYEEQTKIGSYFDSLDNLITLHQHKCEELKKLKKFMLQNMFA
jgi:type I restriction enzyme S subunit